MIHLSSDTGDLFTHSYQFAQRQVKKLIEKHPMLYPLHTKDGEWKHEGQVWTHWSDGFLPGMMWIFYKHAEPESTEAKFWFENAVRYTEPIEERKKDRDAHDLGFLFLSTYYRWNRLHPDAARREVLIEAGRTLATRFKEKGGYLRSFVGDNSLFVDTMMNVGIILYAARESGDRKLRDIALRHARTTRRVLVRGDGSTAHEGIFDTDTGEFLHQATHQGYRGDSCWSRGLSWAMYGFTTVYEYSRDPHYLETAQACADFYITHSPPRWRPAVGFQCSGGEPDPARYFGSGDLRGRVAAVVPAGARFDEGASVLVYGGADFAVVVREAPGQARSQVGGDFEGWGVSRTQRTGRG